MLSTQTRSGYPRRVSLCEFKPLSPDLTPRVEAGRSPRNRTGAGRSNGWVGPNAGLERGAQGEGCQWGPA